METQKAGPKTRRRIIIVGVVALLAGVAALALYATGVLRVPEKTAPPSFTRTEVKRSAASQTVSDMAYKQFFLGDTDGAVATIDKALETEKITIDRIYLLRDKGDIQMNSGRYDDAIATYQQAVALDPDSAVTREGLGFAYEGAGQKDNARATFQKQLELAQKTGLQIQIEDATRNLHEVDS